MKKTKTQKGITLIALIITIVVLMVLAAVAISSIQNDGIIGHAQNAATKYEIAQEKEKLQMEVLEWQLTNYNGIPTLKSYLSEIYGEENVQPNVDNSITVTVPSGNRYVVSQSGEVTLLDGTVEEPTPILPEVILDKTTITKEITSGGTETDIITATLKNASGELIWTSSDTTVAEISGEGDTKTITLKAKGTATITVSYGEYSATCTVNVTEVEMVTITYELGDNYSAFYSFRCEGDLVYREVVTSYQVQVKKGALIDEPFFIGGGLFAYISFPATCADFEAFLNNYSINFSLEDLPCMVASTSVPIWKIGDKEYYNEFPTLYATEDMTISMMYGAG